MTMLNAAVIGVGFWGRNHARVYRDLENVSLLAVCDVDPIRARSVAERYGCSWTTDSDEIFEDKQIDVVSICTPAKEHYNLAMSAIKAGKNVLVEKPMGGDPKGAEDLVKAAEKKGVVLYVGFIERFNPGVERVRKYLQEGRIGEIVLISAHRLSRWPRRITDVGVVKDVAIHDIDVLRYLTQRNPETVFALGGRIRHTYEDYVEVLLKLEGGANVFIEANWLTPRKTRKLVATGTEGIIRLDYLSQEVVVETGKGVFIPAFSYEEPLLRELRSFVNVVDGLEDPKVTGWDGVIALKVADAILNSVRSGRPERVPL